jgi:hypothetical protein
MSEFFFFLLYAAVCIGGVVECMRAVLGRGR